MVLFEEVDKIIGSRETESNPFLRIKNIFTECVTTFLLQHFCQFACFIQLLDISAAANEFTIDKDSWYLEYAINKMIQDFFNFFLLVAQEPYRSGASHLSQDSLNIRTVIAVFNFNGGEFLLQFSELLWGWVIEKKWVKRELK